VGEYWGRDGLDIQRIVMGDALGDITSAGQRNREEGRVVMTQAVPERQ
jgi:hypothetical protein